MHGCGCLEVSPLLPLHQTVHFSYYIFYRYLIYYLRNVIISYMYNNYVQLSNNVLFVHFVSQ